MLGLSHRLMRAELRSHSSRYLRIALARVVRFAVLAAFLSMPLAGQTGAPLTLPDAVRIALDQNPLHKAAIADNQMSAAVIREARSQLMPKITFTESAVRGNDPVFVFGTRLRQQNFTLADLALNRLNTPAPISNFSSRFSGQWNLFDGLQSWFSVSRAKYMQQAVQQQLDRTNQELSVPGSEGLLRGPARTEAGTGGRRHIENGASHRSELPGEGGERHGRGLGPVERKGCDGQTQAGADPGAGVSGTHACATGACSWDARGYRLRPAGDVGGAPIPDGDCRGTGIEGA